MKTYILDASVILTFLLGENSAVKEKFPKILRQAQKGKVKLCSSYLLPLEIGNGLRYTLKDSFLSGEVLKKFIKLPIDFFVFSPLHYKKILQLSYLLETSFYDTSYHFLAKRLRGVFLTCDAQYYKKAKKLKNIEFL